jgi:membrane protease YdiL (CAAX protease family)
MSRPQPQRRHDPLHLTSRDLRWVALLILVGAILLFVGIRLYPKAFPEATIKFELDRKASQARAQEVLKGSGFDVAGYRHASSFAYDDTAKVFLERTLGLSEMNHAVEKTAKIWKWSHRWFRPSQKEEFRCDIAPSGETVEIAHLLPEDGPGAKIPQDQARAIAERFLTGVHPSGLDGLRFIGATTVERKNRTDHVFTWEETSIDWNGGRYRHEVVIQGDQPGGYSQFVHVPETWNRGYQLLRSKNTTAGVVDSVFFLLTILAMVIIIILRARAGRIRWRFGVTFGAIGAALSFLSTMNGFSLALFNYRTADSFGGFITEQIAQGLLRGVATGLAILVIVASGESLYRSAFPSKLSIPGLFTRRGFRTKEFFFSTLGGLFLMAFFLAYQCVFYLLASRLGAWSPAEVPYDELLNSAFPWAFLLLTGFLPAVTEEFASRAFSIPFFTKLLRGRWIAVILAAFIWGFGHATYPNQPFYIRGLEVGLAGIVMGLVMLRFNILACLIWHYTVDALYSGILLMRSGQPYYVITAAVAGGIFVLPFVISLVAYLRTRTFVDPEPIRQGIEPEPELEPAEGAAEGTTPEEAIYAQAAFAPTNGRRALTTIGVSAAVLVLLSLAASKTDLPKSPIRIDRHEASVRAESFLREHGIATEGYRRSVIIQGRIEPDWVRYVQSQGGLKAVRAIWPDVLPVQVWRLRYFKPLQVEELRVHVDATSGRITGFTHSIAEKDSLPSATPSRAESLAVGLLTSAGVSTDGLERKEAADKPREKRMDRHFAWERPDGDPRNVAESRVRIEADVTGDRASGFLTMLHLPEAYERARERHTALWGIALGLVIIGAAGLIGLAIRDASRAHMSGDIPWKKLLRVGLIGSVLALAATLNTWPRFVSMYVTTMPWSSYIVFYAVSLVVSLIVYFVFGWAGVAVARGLHPSMAGLSDPRTLRRMLPGAAVALLTAPMWGRILSLVQRILLGHFPASAGPADLSAGTRLEMAIPGLAAAIGSIVGAFFIAWGLAIVAKLLSSSEWPGRRLRILIPCLLAIGFALLPARAPGEAILGLFWIAVIAAVVWGLIRFVARGNPLAVVAGAYGFCFYRSVASLITEPSPWVRGQGILAGVLLLIPIAWVVIVAGRGRSQARMS